MVEAVSLFFFSPFFSDFRIVSHSPFACNWQTTSLDSEPVITRFPSNICGTSDRQIQIPRNSAELSVLCAWVGLELYVETKCFVSSSFDSVSGAHESKEGHL